MAVQAQQPKTSLNDAFKLFGCCEHCGTAKRTDEARNVMMAIEAETHRRKGAVLGKNLTGAIHGCRPIEGTPEIQSPYYCKYLLKKFALE
jgi:hypothetical protein